MASLYCPSKETAGRLRWLWATRLTAGLYRPPKSFFRSAHRNRSRLVRRHRSTGEALDAADATASGRAPETGEKPRAERRRICATSRAAHRLCARSTTSSKRRSNCGQGDIHIEPFRNGLNVRMRVDGLRAAPRRRTCCRRRSFHGSVAGLNIAERRLPQIRRRAMQAARADIDIRVATMPTQHGEACVIHCF